jgi:L-methionine (R)-S-oxide reductase
MITFNKFHLSDNKEENYKTALLAIKGIIDLEIMPTGNLANVAGLINYFLKDLNWVGFYLVNKGRLEVGPFIGLPACTKIEFNKGVCGTSWGRAKTIIVDDVHQFPGHIACDSASNSEIVVPIIVNGNVVGVLDIDSPKFTNFDQIDKKYLELIVEELKVIFN